VAPAGTRRTMHRRRPSSACPRRQAPLLAGPRAPTAAAKERASPSHPTWSTPRSASLPHPTRLRLQLQLCSRLGSSSPCDSIPSRFRRADTERMGENGLVTTSRWRRRPRSVNGRRTRGGRKMASNTKAVAARALPSSSCPPAATGTTGIATSPRHAGTAGPLLPDRLHATAA
jgi:hypothetical protein